MAVLLFLSGVPPFCHVLSRRSCLVDCYGRQDLEHLYYGCPLPLEDDLTYVARANVAAPFDPQPVSAAEALGLRELNDLTEGDQSQLAERWRSFSSQRGSEVGPDGVPLKPRCARRGGDCGGAAWPISLRAHTTAGGRAVMKHAGHLHSETDDSVFLLYVVHGVAAASPWSFFFGLW